MATDESARVEFKLRCNETAIKPQITFEKSFIGIEGSPDEYIFNVQTRNVCLRPTVTCEASRLYMYSCRKSENLLCFFFQSSGHGWQNLGGQRYDIWLVFPENLERGMDSGCWVQDFSSGRLQDAQPLFHSIPLPKHKFLSLQHRQRGIIGFIHLKWLPIF